MAHFSGSYAPEDVVFLLKQVTMPDTPVSLKEALIQSGQKHYSELLTRETLPEPAYLDLFYEAMSRNQERLARHLLVLAKRIIANRPGGITLVSLLRAGTPIGVLLKRILKHYFKRDVSHYSISILRDVGIDSHALQHIVQRHAPETLVFVDGWTGKGVIAGQLRASLQAFTSAFGVHIPAELYVLADVSGSADIAATTTDYLIPSCLLNATVSGLVSRSIYPSQADEFHGCVYYAAFEPDDLSGYFVDAVLKQVDKLWQSTLLNDVMPELGVDYPGHQTSPQRFLIDLSERYAVKHLHHIKPGLGEATRVLLRRQPRLLILQSAQATDTQHLRWLAETNAVPVEIMPSCPYQAIALIKEI